MLNLQLIRKENLTQRVFKNFFLKHSSKIICSNVHETVIDCRYMYVCLHTHIYLYIYTLVLYSQ